MMFRLALLAALFAATASLAGEGPAATGQVVVILPFGKVEPALLEGIAREVRARVNAETRVDAVRPLPKAAFYAPRNRWRAEKLLEAIDADPPLGAWKVLAVTEAEISTTKGQVHDWGIAGLGNIGGQSCVVTGYLYRKHGKTRADLVRRLNDTAVHELGHTLGLDHCPTVGCVMRDAKGNAIKSTDTSTGQYCALCRAKVGEGVLLPGQPVPPPTE